MTTADIVVLGIAIPTASIGVVAGLRAYLKIRALRKADRIRHSNEAINKYRTQGAN